MKKGLYIVIIVTTLIVVVTGLTFAYFNWSSTSENKDIGVDVTIAGLDDSVITYNVTNEGNANLVPVANKTQGYITNIEISQIGLERVSGSFILTLNTLPTALIHPTFKYVFVSVSNGVETTLASGSFGDNTQGDVITLQTGLILNRSTTYNYRLYIYIDGEDPNYPINPDSMQNQTYSFTLNANLTDQIS